MYIKKLYNSLFIVAPWVILAGMLQVNFQKFLPYQRIFKGAHFFDYFTVTDIFVTLLVAIFAIGLLRRAIVWNERKVPVELKICVLLLLAAGVLQVVFQKVYEPVLSTPTEYFRMLFIYPLIFALLVFRTLDDQAVAKIVKSYVIMVLFFCILALTQYLFGIFPGEQYDFTKRLVWPFVDFVSLKSSSANWAAFFVTPALIVSFIKVFDCFKRAKFDADYLIFNAAFFLSALTLYLTQSYGAFVAVFAAIAFFLYRALKLRGFIIAFLIMLLLGGGVYAMQAGTYKYKILTNQVNYRYDNSAASRGDIMKMNLAMIGAHPILGVGLNQYQSYFTVNQEAVFGHKYGESHIPPHAHNFFLSFWTSLGVFGFAAMVILTAGLFWRTRFKPDHPFVFVFLAIMIHGLIDSYYWRQEIAYVFWVVVVFSYLFRLGDLKNPAK